MKNAKRLFMAPLLLASMSHATAAFECPNMTDVAPPDWLPTFERLMPAGDDLIAPDQLKAAASELKQRGVPDDDAVNSLFAAYCPRIAGNAALDDTEMNNRASEFIIMATHVIFGSAP